MPRRYTIKQLGPPSNVATINKEYLNDLEILRDLAKDRLDKTTNIYSPLSLRLGKILRRLDHMIEQGDDL